MTDRRSIGRTVGRTDGWRRSQYPHRFLKKNVGIKMMMMIISLELFEYDA